MTSGKRELDSPVHGVQAGRQGNRSVEHPQAIVCTYKNEALFENVRAMTFIYTREVYTDVL